MKLYVLNSKWYVDICYFQSRKELKDYAASFWPKEVWGWDFKALYLWVPRKRWHKGTICLLKDTPEEVIIHEMFHAATNMCKRLHKNFEFKTSPDKKTSKKTKQYYEKDNRKEEFSAAVMESFYEQWRFNHPTSTNPSKKE